MLAMCFTFASPIAVVGRKWCLVINVCEVQSLREENVLVLVVMLVELVTGTW